MASHVQLPTCMALKFVKAIASPRYAYECLYGRSAVAWLYSHKVERRSKDKVQAVWCNLKHAQAECYCWTLVVLCCRFQIWVKRKDKQHRFLWKSLLCSEHVWVCVNRNGSSRGKLNVCLPVCVSFNWVPLGRKEGRNEIVCQHVICINIHQWRIK